MQNYFCTILFTGTDKHKWLETVCSYKNSVRTDEIADDIWVKFIDVTNSDELEPFHYVLFSCLMEYIKSLPHRGKIGHIVDENSQLHHYMYDTLKFDRYWLENYNFEHSADDKVLNIWKVTQEEKEPHSQRIHDYFKQKYFPDKDLSALKLSILELYYNAVDHAHAAQNVFSFIRYDEITHKLQVAICDFGIGIAASIKEHFDVANDVQAVIKALEPGISIRSKTYNKGQGLNNIAGVLFAGNELTIISNCAEVRIGADMTIIETKQNSYNFEGTLIYFDVSMDKFETEEIIEQFSF